MAATRASSITACKPNPAAPGSSPPAGPSRPSRPPSSRRCARLHPSCARFCTCRAIRTRAQRSAQRLTDQLTQPLPVERLLDALVGHAVEKFLRARRERAAGHEHNPAGLNRQLLLELVEEVHAAHLRHHEIAEDQI